MFDSDVAFELGEEVVVEVVVVVLESNFAEVDSRAATDVHVHRVTRRCGVRVMTCVLVICAASQRLDG